MVEKIYLYSIWVRLWHLVNAILIIILIFTGIAMQYAGMEYTFIGFRSAVIWHNVVGIILSVSYIVFLIFNWLTGNYKYYIFHLDSIWKDMRKQFMYYILGVFRNDPPPFPIDEKRKFNPMQKFTYALVMYFILPLVVITGWGLLFPEINLPRLFGTTGLHLTDIFHIITGYILSIFMLIHIYFCTMGATYISNFKGMIDGYHIKH